MLGAIKQRELISERWAVNYARQMRRGDTSSDVRFPLTILPKKRIERRGKRGKKLNGFFSARVARELLH